MIAGITGGIGCGKSTVVQLLGRRGLRPLDSDALIREKVLRDPEVVGALRARYGSDALREDGAVNRAFVGDRVFADEAELRWIEELTHPLLFALWRAAFSADPEVRWAVEVPLLFEKRLENWFDFTVCVACSPEQQLARLERRGLSRALAGQRISKQLLLAQKVELSDIVLWNEGSTAFLEAQIDHLARALAAA